MQEVPCVAVAQLIQLNEGSLFIKCCHDGQLNQKVIQALYQVAPPDLFWKLVKCKSSDRKIVRVDDLPSEWSRNAIFPRKVASSMSKINWSR